MVLFLNYTNYFTNRDVSFSIMHSLKPPDLDKHDPQNSKIYMVTLKLQKNK
jgi:hypothetical protein